MELNARQIALKWHGDQKYGGQPYEFHLNHVASLLASHGFKGKNSQAAAWLHDVLEDTDATEQDLLDAGVDPMVVRAVVFMTDEPGANRRERKAETYARITTQQLDVFHDLGLALGFRVKVYDRLANMLHCVRMSRYNKDLHRMYRREAAQFKAALYLQNDPFMLPAWHLFDSLVSMTKDEFDDAKFEEAKARLLAK